MVPSTLARPVAEVSPERVVSVADGVRLDVERAMYLGGRGLVMLPKDVPDMREALRAAPTLTLELYVGNSLSTLPLDLIMVASIRLKPDMPA